MKTLIKINLSFIKYKIVYFSLNRLCSLNFLPVNRVKNKHSNVRLMIQVVGSRRENRKEKRSLHVLGGRYLNHPVLVFWDQQTPRVDRIEDTKD